MTDRTSTKIDAMISDGARMRPLDRMRRKITNASGGTARLAVVIGTVWVALVWLAVLVFGSMDVVRAHAQLVVGIVLMVLPLVWSNGVRTAIRRLLTARRETQPIRQAQDVPNRSPERPEPVVEAPAPGHRRSAESRPTDHLSTETISSYVHGELRMQAYLLAAQHISECATCAAEADAQQNARVIEERAPAHPSATLSRDLASESMVSKIQKAGRKMTGASAQSVSDGDTGMPRLGNEYGQLPDGGVTPIQRTVTTIAPMNRSSSTVPRRGSDGAIRRPAAARGLRFDAASWSDAGPRTENQDGALIRDKLLVIADGVGGRSAGAEAAREAIAIVARTMEHPLASPVEAVMAANEALRSRQVAEDYEDQGRATTLDIVYLDEANDLGGAHVGDSRAYVLPANGSRLIQLTTDHSRGNMLTRSIGGSETVTPDVWIHEIAPGDLVLVATDGLWKGRFDEHAVARMMVAGRGNPPDRIARTLVETARDGAVDNITVIVAEVVQA